MYMRSYNSRDRLQLLQFSRLYKRPVYLYKKTPHTNFRRRSGLRAGFRRSLALRSAQKSISSGAADPKLCLRPWLEPLRAPCAREALICSGKNRPPGAHQRAWVGVAPATYSAARLPSGRASFAGKDTYAMRQSCPSFEAHRRGCSLFPWLLRTPASTAVAHSAPVNVECSPARRVCYVTPEI